MEGIVCDHENMLTGCDRFHAALSSEPGETVLGRVVGAVAVIEGYPAERPPGGGLEAAQKMTSVGFDFKGIAPSPRCADSCPW